LLAYCELLQCARLTLYFAKEGVAHDTANKWVEFITKSLETPVFIFLQQLNSLRKPQIEDLRELFSLLDSLIQMEAIIPQDKIFAILDLATHDTFLIIDIDYSKPFD
jgi:hypothetical protein